MGTTKGLVVVTGCSHPGIVDIVKRAKEIGKKDIYLVVGGFHLMRHSELAVKKNYSGVQKPWRSENISYARNGNDI